MSSLTIQCSNPRCQHALKIRTEYVGRRVRCKYCGEILFIPLTDTSPLIDIPPTNHDPKESGEPQIDPYKLNQEQREAAEFSGHHALVLAGAGTGKTRTIIARAAHLIRTGVAPSRILAMTFTRRAARELSLRLESIVGTSSGEVAAGTFHNFCLSTMRRMPRKFGIENSTVIDRDDQNQLMKLSRGAIDSQKSPFPKATDLVNYYSYARNTNRPIYEYLFKHTDHNSETIEKMCRVFAGYEERKRKHLYLDYDDILSRFAGGIHENHNLRDQLSGLYDHILVDEMQDTNPLQWLILDGLREPAALFCVGDDAQSIYAFRGADFQNVHSFTKRVPKSSVLKLHENFRSTQGILDVANWLLRKSPLKYNKELHAFRGNGVKPRLIDFESEDEEASWIAKDLLRRNNDGAEWRDHMILTRTAYGSRRLEAALIEKQIPYEFIGGTSLLQAAHVKDLLAMIRCSTNHRDELAWTRFLTLWPKIGDVTALKLVTGMSSFSDSEGAFKRLQSDLSGRPEILSGLEGVHQCWHTPSLAIDEARKCLEPLLKQSYDRWESRRKDFELLSQIAQRHKSLHEFLDTYTLDTISTTSARQLEISEKVTLITVHSAKGTEAKVCYLIRVEPGMYPHIRSLGKKDEEEEERRILYVAMTRARDELLITRSNSRGADLTFHGGANAQHSPGGEPYLLQGVPKELVDQEVIGFMPC